MARFDNIWNVLDRYKHLIIIVVGLLFVGVLSDTSLRALMKLDATKRNLQAEVNYYVVKRQEAERQLKALQSSREAVEKVARERYFMKYDNEDVFVLSSELDNGQEEEGFSYAK